VLTRKAPGPKTGVEISEFTAPQKTDHVGVTISIDMPNSAVVAPAIPWLASFLSYPIVEEQTDGSRPVVHRASYAGRDERGRWTIPAGLVPRCQRELEARGFHVEINDRRQFGPCFNGDAKALRDADNEERAWMETVIREPVGQIEVRDGLDMVERIRLLQKLYPLARLIFAVATEEKLRKASRFLEKHLGQGIGRIGTQHHERGKQCCVCIYQELVTIAKTGNQILLLPDAELAIEHIANYGTDCRAFPSVYSVIRLDQRCNDRPLLDLNAVVGELIWRVPRATAVRVLMIETPACPIDSRWAGLERKRRLLWHNSNRNQLIATVAQAFVRRDRKTLQECGLPRHEFHYGRTVVVLVESTEHGHQLLELMPGWAMLDASPKEDGLEFDSNYYAESKPPQGWVMTLVYADRSGIAADVLVRATGGRGKLRLNGFPNERNSATSSALLIDFDDQGDFEARTDTALRVEDYRQNAFQMVNKTRTTKH
jgi:hypothetical protein